jgi:NAD(P)-dependent dehydrogenase (short-subunit alcohol dehydrogenase family)
MDRLEGKVCVVSGGASGIGLALARRFRGAGMRVAIGDVEAEVLAAAVGSLGGAGAGVLGVQCDVTSPGDVLAFRDTVLEHFGGVHVVCLNAGVAAVGPVVGTTVDMAASLRTLVDDGVERRCGMVSGADRSC